MFDDFDDYMDEIEDYDDSLGGPPSGSSGGSSGGSSEEESGGNFPCPSGAPDCEEEEVPPYDVTNPTGPTPPNNTPDWVSDPFDAGLGFITQTLNSLGASNLAQMWGTQSMYAEEMADWAFAQEISEDIDYAQTMNASLTDGVAYVYFMDVTMRFDMDGDGENDVWYRDHRVHSGADENNNGEIDFLEALGIIAGDSVITSSDMFGNSNVDWDVDTGHP